jgi:hypothetical protein
MNALDSPIMDALDSSILDALDSSILDALDSSILDALDSSILDAHYPATAFHSATLDALNIATAIHSTILDINWSYCGLGWPRGRLHIVTKSGERHPKSPSPGWSRLAVFIRPIEPEASSIASPLCQSCLRFLQKHKTQASYTKEMAVHSLAYHNETNNFSETLEQRPKSLFLHGVHGVPLLLGIRCSRCSRCAGFDKCCLRLITSLTRVGMSGKHNRCVLVTLLITLKETPLLTCEQNTETDNLNSALADPD